MERMPGAAVALAFHEGHAMTKSRQNTEPAPKETEPGQQQDDNIDDLGRRPDGTKLDQPIDPEEPRQSPPAKDDTSSTRDKSRR